MTCLVMVLSLWRGRGRGRLVWLYPSPMVRLRTTYSVAACSYGEGEYNLFGCGLLLWRGQGQLVWLLVPNPGHHQVTMGYFQHYFCLRRVNTNFFCAINFFRKKPESVNALLL